MAVAPQVIITFCSLFVEITDRHSASPSSSSSREKNIVIRAAFVHVLGDLLQSVGVLVAALVIKFKVRFGAGS